MFMHGSWFHIIGNMWFLWVFGNNVEDSLGRFRYAIFYVLCGLAAAATQALTNPASAIPMVGASGAIGGVMGAYAVRYPHARVLTLILLGIIMRTVWVPAWLMLGYWFLLQFLGGLPALASEEGGVAFWAHVGGFVAGVVLLYVMRVGAPRPVPYDRAIS
jgi:membrane associated rhomboid family serine protease